MVKWVGGKTKLLPELTARLPKTYNRYFEPFAGGAALYFYLAPQKAYLSDSNGDLIGMYRELSINTERVLATLRRFKAAHCETHYYRIRSRFNGEGRALVGSARAAAFIYLNKTCFNGLWRVNRKGHYNVPIGRYANPKICDTAKLKRSAELLVSTHLSVGSYLKAAARGKKGDLFYFDPPYHPLSTTSNFTSYTKNSFTEDDQRLLAETARSLKDRGCYVMLSNSDTPFIRSLYHDFKVEQVKCSRAINSNAAKRGSVNEVIITGY